MMKRLTKRIFVPTEERELVVFTHGEYIDTIPAEMTHEDIRKVLRKLAKYEDLEEQGLMLRLPCKIGDIIYEVSYENREFVIKEHIVKEFIYRAYRFPKSREEKEMKSYENGYKKMNKQIIKDAIKFHGADEQTTVCMEECAELIQAISKEKRGKHDKQHLIEEIADVYICLEMLMEIYNISSKEIESMIERKQQREIERMREQK